MTRPDWNKMKQAIKEILERHGYKDYDNNDYQMSFYELSLYLNNCWYASLFVTKKNEKSLLGKGRFRHLEDYDLYKLRNRIRATVKKFSCFDHIEQKHRYGIINEFVRYVPRWEGS